MKEFTRMIIVLTLFGAGAGFLLAWTNNVTGKPIATAKQAEKMDALRKILPPCDNDVVADARMIKENDRTWTFFIGKQKGAFSGAAFESTSTRGYGGLIRIMVGVKADDAINGIAILEAERETPGLGSKIKEPRFKDQFTGKKASETCWCAVKKDKGELDAITGATISSRAVAEAVKSGLEVYIKNKQEITK